MCAYDRAGQGWSEDAAAPRTASPRPATCTPCSPQPARPGPYVLVGHSTGGTYALTYAAQYPQQVAGMVLLDSSSPEQITSIPSYAGQYAVHATRLGPPAHADPDRSRLGCSAPAPACPRRDRTALRR